MEEKSANEREKPKSPKLWIGGGLIALILVVAVVLFSLRGSSKIEKAEECIEVGMYEEAIKLLEREAERNRKSPQIHLLLGRAHLYNGEEDLNPAIRTGR